MTKVINLYGGPGCGKSTTAAHLFALMKHEGYKVELVREYAKELCYTNRLTITPALHIVEEQLRGQTRLLNKVDYIITDSPLLLGLVYASSHDIDYQSLVNAYNSFNNIQVLIKRTKPFQQYGRLQNEQEARDKDIEIKEMLCQYSLGYYMVKGNKSAAKNILKALRLELKGL